MGQLQTDINAVNGLNDLEDERHGPNRWYWALGEGDVVIGPDRPNGGDYYLGSAMRRRRYQSKRSRDQGATYFVVPRVIRTERFKRVIGYTAVMVALFGFGTMVILLLNAVGIALFPDSTFFISRDHEPDFISGLIWGFVSGLGVWGSYQMNQDDKRTLTDVYGEAALPEHEWRKRTAWIRAKSE